MFSSNKAPRLDDDNSSDEIATLMDDDDESDGQKVTAATQEITSSNVESVEEDSLWPVVTQWTAIGSNAASSLLDRHVHLSIGIDEAGRGSCMGPMVYGLCAVETNKISDFFQRTGAMDSKQMNHKKRIQSASSMVDVKNEGDVGVFWSVQVVDADVIDKSRLCRYPKSLNELSMNTVFALLDKFLEDLSGNGAKFTIEKITIDAIGPDKLLYNRAMKHISRSDGMLNKQEITPVVVAESKADSKYTEVGAASIWAKLTRDRLNKTCEFKENLQFDRNWGCGYPSDTEASNWLKNNLHSVFGFPRVVRHSWKNVKAEVECKAIEVTWPSDDSDVVGQRDRI
eukprot:GHVH01009616.1.p1 GENE.GHVH01009616.1~~GHVH01009616.1.p1  ORF type:complete len:341 (+),score=48.58 GHVH01009616.1:873-1895(+)